MEWEVVKIVFNIFFYVFIMGLFLDLVVDFLEIGVWIIDGILSIFWKKKFEFKVLLVVVFVEF